MQIILSHNKITMRYNYLTIYLFLYMCFITLNSFSQKENYYWCFGRKTNINFSVSPIVADDKAMLNSVEGSASIADRTTGRLLFYTDGVTVWDSTHNIMLNGTGLMGGYSTMFPIPSSSSQSSIIVPVCNTDIYYVFTSDCLENGNANGFRYSIVDMSLNNGLGAITSKNVLLFAPCTEKVTAFHHSNKKDIWVIAHGKGNNKFYAYLVTTAGVSAPVITGVGEINIRPNGYLKISPNGKKLVCVESADLNRTRYSTQIFDFDNSTGIVSNPISIDESYYGASFSPNSSKLYLAHNAKLDQYDLLAGTPADIVASRTNVNPNPRLFFYGLQMGPDNKIYCASGFPTFMHIIDKPDLSGVACNVLGSALPLKQMSRLGVPNFVESFFDTANFIIRKKIDFNSSIVSTSSGSCVGDSVSYSIIPTFPGVDSIQWSINDKDRVYEYITSNFNTPGYHTYRYSGTYLVRAILFVQCMYDTVYTTVTINDCDHSLYVPNSFTPDGNGINDLFLPKGVNAEGFNMKIFDRWGSLIFETNNINNGWEGTFHGNKCQQDVYVWMIKYKIPSGLVDVSNTSGEYTLHGKVTLLR